MAEETIIIVGGVAGGATAAARARRLNERAKIILFERGPYVSFANCGLPYHISGDIKKRSQLLLQTPEGFESRYGVQALVNTEVVEIDRPGSRVRVQGPQGEAWYSYDKLILAQGGNPIVPPLPGADAPQVFKLWNVPDMDRIQKFLEDQKPQHAVVAGGGFIGLEMAEAFHSRGLKVTVVELAPQVMSVMDEEFGHMIQSALEAAGIGVLTGVGAQAYHSGTRELELSDGRRLPADLVLFSVGVRPELTLAKAAGLDLGPAGGVLVSETLQTSDPKIWAVGDMVEITHRVSGKKVRLPLAGPANRQGRIAATNALGGSMKYRGALGTSVVKVLDQTAASTGLTEKAARDLGLNFDSVTVVKDNHAGYYPGGQEMNLKLVFEKPSGRLLGAQGFGGEGVEKRIDVLATALMGRLTLDDLAELDLAYAPPYSSANDPVNMAAFVGQNSLSGFSPSITGKEFLARMGQSLVLDVRNLGEYAKGHVKGAVNIPVDELRYRLDEVPRDRDILVHCRVGFRGHIAARILLEHGYTRVWNLTGGWASLVHFTGFVPEV